MVEAAITSHIIHVFTQSDPALSSDGIGLSQQVFQTVVGGDPLCGRFGAHPGNSGEIVGGFSDKCRDFRVAVRGDSVFVFHGLRGHFAHVIGALSRVEDGDVFGDRLEAIAVARGDENAPVALITPVREGREDVVCLVPLSA